MHQQNVIDILKGNVVDGQHGSLQATAGLQLLGFEGWLAWVTTCSQAVGGHVVAGLHGSLQVTAGLQLLGVEGWLAWVTARH